MADDAFASDGIVPAQPEEHRREALRIRTLALIRLRQFRPAITSQVVDFA
jgi:hypothetical protein